MHRLKLFPSAQECNFFSLFFLVLALFIRFFSLLFIPLGFSFVFSANFSYRCSTFSDSIFCPFCSALCHRDRILNATTAFSASLQASCTFLPTACLRFYLLPLSQKPSHLKFNARSLGLMISQNELSTKPMTPERFYIFVINCLKFFSSACWSPVSWQGPSALPR